jgi:hypothetical protein
MVVLWESDWLGKNNRNAAEMQDGKEKGEPTTLALGGERDL